MFLLKWLFRIVLVFGFFVFGGAAGDGWVFQFVGWCFLVWVIVRAAPGMLEDFKTLWFFGSYVTKKGVARFAHKSNFYM
jgi:hypothetical protein